jgi:hypothetical protein
MELKVKKVDRKFFLAFSKLKKGLHFYSITLYYNDLKEN